MSAVVVVGCGSDSGSTADSGVSSSPSSAESATVASEPTLDTAPPAIEASPVPLTVPAIESVAIEDAGAVRFDVAGEPDWLTLAGGSVFAYTTGVGRFDAATGDLLARVDESSNQVTQFYDPASGSGSVAADDEAVWLSAHDVNSMWRLPLK